MEFEGGHARRGRKKRRKKKGKKVSSGSEIKHSGRGIEGPCWQRRKGKQDEEVVLSSI